MCYRQAEFPLELERKRQQLPCAQFVPSHFKREPLRELESFAPHEKLVRLEIALDIQPHPITMVWMDNLAMFLTAPQINALGRIFSRFVNCRALILRNAGLKKLDPFVLPALTYCDLESNKVSDLNQLLGFARRNPRIQALNMLGNPVAQTSSWRTALPEFTVRHLQRPPRAAARPLPLLALTSACSAQSDAWKLLLALPDLLLLNQHQLSMKDHMHAAKLRGNVRDRSRAELMQWDHAICTRVPDISSLMRWDPAAIQELHLGECELTTFHVGSLRALELLDLSGNKVESLLGTGLEKCDNLLVRVRALPPPPLCSSHRLAASGSELEGQPAAYVGQRGDAGHAALAPPPLLGRHAPQPHQPLPPPHDPPHALRAGHGPVRRPAHAGRHGGVVRGAHPGHNCVRQAEEATAGGAALAHGAARTAWPARHAAARVPGGGERHPPAGLWPAARGHPALRAAAGDLGAARQ